MARNDLLGVFYLPDIYLWIYIRRGESLLGIYRAIYVCVLDFVYEHDRSRVGRIRLWVYHPIYFIVFGGHVCYNCHHVFCAFLMFV